MADELVSLQRRVSKLERRLTELAICCALLISYVLFSQTRDVARAAGQPSSLTLKRLAIVDASGTERVVIAAPAPDPMIEGKRVHRDGLVSGILIYDPKGNERGGYVTSDTGDLSAFLTLDSEHDQVFTAYANAANGATVWATNGKRDAVAFSTHQQPVLEVIQDRKVVYKQPRTAPDLHQ